MSSACAGIWVSPMTQSSCSRRRACCAATAISTSYYPAGALASISCGKCIVGGAHQRHSRRSRRRRTVRGISFGADVWIIPYLKTLPTCSEPALQLLAIALPVAFAPGKADELKRGVHAASSVDPPEGRTRDRIAGRFDFTAAMAHYCGIRELTQKIRISLATRWVRAREAVQQQRRRDPSRDE